MTIRVLQGHVLDVLAGLPERSVHAVVTSPPYWQLRAYGTPPQVWGGAPGCPHEWEDVVVLPKHKDDGASGSTLVGSTTRQGACQRVAIQMGECARCGAWRGELGQEPTPELYVDHLVAVFRAVRRVLRDDGSLWVNLAGCYWNDAGGQNGAQGTVSPKAIVANGQQGRTRKHGHPVYKALDYVDVPGLVARALQADGWLWRSDVALVKSAPMPESVSGTRWERCRRKRSEGDQSPGTGQRKVSAVRDGQHGNRDVGSFESAEARAEWADCPGCPKCAATGGLVLRRGSGRPTRAWERLLVLAKKPGYYFDCEAVREPVSAATLADGRTARGVRGTTGEYAAVDGNCGYNPAGRNARDWLLWRPQPLKAQEGESEHYAAFPPMLPEVAVKAGTSARGCCPGCGAPWARVISTTQERLSVGGYGHMGRAEHGVDLRARDDLPVDRTRRIDTTLGWKQTCACPPHTPRPAVILDCFGGSGTSGIVADRLGRDAVLIELKPSYAALALSRVTRDAPLLTWGQVTLEGAAPAEPAEEPDGRTKQEQHPNRTVAGFNQRWKATTTPRVPEGVPLPLEEPEDAVAGG